MSDGTWNPWKLTAIGLALVMVTALVSGMVVANWSGRAEDKQALEPAQTTARAVAPQPAASPRLAAAPAPAPVAPAPAAPARPSQSVVEECNRVASQPTTRDKTVEVVKDAAIAAVVGAAVGAAGGAIADGGKGAGKGAAIGGVVGAGAGTLYGLNENSKNSQRARDAYAACMRARGY
jgi:hypothetical protein